MRSRSNKVGLGWPWVAIGGVLIGCGGTTVVDAGGGSPRGSCAAEPRGPYGVGEGERLDPGLCFAELAEGAWRERCLGDLCDGPEVAVVTAQAVWGLPSKEDSDGFVDVVVRMESVEASGGFSMLVLTDGVDPGVPADEANLEALVAAFDIDVSAAIDPGYVLGAQLETWEHPVYWLIDGRTLEVRLRSAGFPGAPGDEVFWEAVATALEPE